MDLYYMYSEPVVDTFYVLSVCLKGIIVHIFDLYKIKIINADYVCIWIVGAVNPEQNNDQPNLPSDDASEFIHWFTVRCFSQD